MSTGRIPIPPASAARLQEWLRIKAECDGLVETTVRTLREALNVPDDWEIHSVEQGFVAPDGEQAQNTSALDVDVHAVGD